MILRIGFLQVIAFLSISLPLFFSFSPFASLVKFPGEVLPYSLIIAPCLFIFNRDNYLSVNRWLLFSFAVLVAPFIVFGVLRAGDFQLSIKNLAYLSPLAYFFCYSSFSNIALDARVAVDVRKVIFCSAIIMLAFVFLGYFSPPSLNFIRGVFVNDLGNRETANLLGYSGSPGLFSEPSYQALISVSIFSSSLVSPLRNINLKIALVSLLTILLTRSLLGIGLAVVMIVFRCLLALLYGVVLSIRLQKLSRYSIFFSTICFISCALVVIGMSASYARLERLIDLISGIDLSNVSGSLLEIEQSFGSNRLFAQQAQCPEPLIRQLFSLSYSTNSISSCIAGFSTFQQLGFAIGYLPSVLFLGLASIALFLYSSSHLLLENRKPSLYWRILSIFFTAFNLFFLGPVASPFLYMPLLLPFGVKTESL